MYLVGEFRAKEAAVAAIQLLRDGGVDSGDLDVFSQQPVEFPPGVLDRPSRMSLVSVAGAIGFGALATTFVYYTQHDYKLVTGGMPLFSFWATGVITYEMTMVGAIVAAFVAFLWESGLIRKRDHTAPAPETGPGLICVRVRCLAEQAPHAIEIMRRAGAIHIERTGEA